MPCQSSRNNEGVNDSHALPNVLSGRVLLIGSQAGKINSNIGVFGAQKKPTVSQRIPRFLPSLTDVLSQATIPAMDPLAVALNETLKGTVVHDLLSPMGKRFFFPRGIVAQAAEAAARAHRYDATAGIARAGKQAMHLPGLKKLIPDLNPDQIFNYAPTAGIKELRTAWKDWLVRKNPGLTDARFSLPVVVSGITCGLSVIADLFIGDVDPVLLPDLHWDNYQFICSVKKEARVVTWPFFDGRGGLNTAALGESLKGIPAGSKAVVILNFPNNPTGYTPSGREKDLLVGTLLEAAESGVKLCVVTDDSYFGLFYDPDAARESLFSSLCGLHPRLLAVKLDGATKEDFVWGFRIGFITFGCRALTDAHYGALLEKTSGVIRATVSNSSTPAQYLLLNAYRQGQYESEKTANLALLAEKYRKVREITDNLPEGLPARALPFNSGYFMCLELLMGDAENLRRHLLSKGIGTVAVDPRHLRVAYASVETGELQDFFNGIFDGILAVCA
jgi:aspartate/methionine/tyrosine aminotransferase